VARTYGCSRIGHVTVSQQQALASAIVSFGRGADCLFSLCRSLGDAVAHTAGVISDPEFTDRELDPESDRFLVIATDGLWEFVDNKETIEMAEAQTTPSEAVDCLVQEACQRWMQEEQVIDDTTVIVANLFGYKSQTC
jgi:serine/threonine protein phosphatase PrpC